MQLPLHPMLVHFPIAFFFLEIVLLGVWIFKKDESFQKFAVFTFWAAFLGMMASAVSGWLEVGGWHNIQGPVAEHFYGAVSVLIIQTLRALYWKMGNPRDSKGAWICFAGALLGLAAICYTAHHGGELVFGNPND